MTYELLECRGCHHHRLRTKFEPNGSDDTTTLYYPPALARRPPPWRVDLPARMLELLEEIYIAMHNDARRLVLMGTRTLVDMLILDQVGDVGSFKQKLVALKDKGVITQQSSEVLEAALDAGSAAAHRGHRPTSEQMNTVIDIVEHLLEATYHLGRVAARLRLVTPPRPPRK